MSDQQGFARTLAGELGVSVSDEQWAQLARFWALLLTWNARINLTGAGTPDELLGEHFPDSLTMARLVPSRSSIADVGSGGGLPALPFAILRPDTAVTLVEPRAKRAAFLRTAVRELRLAAEVVAKRVEELPERPIDLASSRATFAPEEWLPKAKVLASRALVFTAGPWTAPGATLEDAMAYRTAAGHRRWAGRFRFT